MRDAQEPENHVDVAGSVVRAFSMRRLSVVPELIAARHEFVFEGRRVHVHVPHLDGEHVRREFRRIECNTWKAEGHVPLYYQVNELDVEVEVGHSISIPQAIFSKPPRQDTLVSPAERKLLDETTEILSAVAGRAFERWLRVMRWKSGFGEINEPEIFFRAEGGATLLETKSRRRFWLESVRISVMADFVVDVPKWTATQEALAAENYPPVWFDFLFDGGMRINNRDLSAAALSLAIALETSVRAIFSKDLKARDVDPVALEIFDRTNLRTLLNRLRSLRIWDNDWDKAADLRTFNELMNLRDKVMHLAETKDIEEKALRKMYKAVKEFAYSTCDHLNLN